ncbi:MAG: hypothetical protein ACRYFS_07305 [Janthinobacterium lividum]
MELTTIEAALMAPQLMQDWKDTLEEWTAATPLQSLTVLNKIIAQRDEFLQAARDIDDSETLDMVAAIRYIELKCHWIMLNTQINYLAVFRGETDMSAAYYASLISQMLEPLEHLIGEEDIHRILDFLTQPLMPKLD